MRITVQPKSYHEKISDEKRKRFFFRFFIVLTISIVIAGGLTYLIFFAGVFDIKSVTVAETKSIDAGDIRSKIESLITHNGPMNTQSNILFFDSDNAKRKILTAFPSIQTVSIKRNPPHELVVEIKEREAIGIWCFNSADGSGISGDCSFFDEYGATWGETIPSRGSLLLVVEDSQVRSSIPATLLDHVRALHESLLELDLSVDLIRVRYGLTEDIRINLKEGWYILATTNYPVSEQRDNLKVIIDQQEDGSVLNYIDLRIQGRVYFK